MDAVDGRTDRQLLSLLTLQVLFLRSCLFVCGGLAHSSGHLRPRQGVLRRGDAVRQRLTRHLLSVSSVRSGPTPPTHPNERPASVIPAALENTTEMHNT